MFIPRIYYPQPLKCGDQITFDKTTAHYLMTVLRLKNEERIILFNGNGGEYDATFFIAKKQGSVSILNFHDISRESPLQLHLGQGLARGDRMDFVVQKATELGIKSITPLFTKNCAVKLDEDRKGKRLEHWQKIAISACEQCGRTVVPHIHAPRPLTEWVSQPFSGSSIILDPTGSHPLKTCAPNIALRLAIGPESGWDEHETALMVKNDFTRVTVGPRILRTETASIAAISILQGLFGDFS